MAYRDGAGHDVKLKLVGKLPMRMSVFQGTVLVSAKNFTKLWPASEGFRVFLLDAPVDASEKFYCLRVFSDSLTATVQMIRPNAILLSTSAAL